MDEASADQQRNGHHQPGRRNGDSGGNGDTPETEADPSAAAYSGPFYSLRLKLVVVLVALSSVTAFVVLYMRTSDGDDEPTAASTGSDGIEGLHPTEGSQALQQDAVIVDLAPGWDGRLTIDGRAIPETDLTRAARENQPPRVGESDREQPQGAEDRLEFVPGEDKVMRELPSGRTCVTVEAWQRAIGPEVRTDTVSWCFTVL